MSKLQSPRGTRDLVDELVYFARIEDVARLRFAQSGFKRIETPFFEHVEVFDRSIGKDSDIISKEMYDFRDKGDNWVSLRPEMTAGICRAYLQNKMYALPQPTELWYMGAAFRYDRPQKGRYRQFYQLGAEIIGESSPMIDAQVILLCKHILEDLGLGDDVTLQLNSIGSRESREAYLDVLKKYYDGKERSLCEKCISRKDSNPMRLLDCKSEDCKILADVAPKITDHLSKEDAALYTDLKKYLDALNVKYVENSSLVRGLDYYCHTVFEFWNDHDGAQNSLGGGGRYDYLIEEFGGEQTPAIGFAFGVDRIVNEMIDKDVVLPKQEKVDIFVAGLGDDAKVQSLQLIDALHEESVPCVGGMGKQTMKAQLKLADNLKVRYVLLIGEVEVSSGVVLVRDMEKGSQEKIPFDKVVSYIKKKV